MVNVKYQAKKDDARMTVLPTHVKSKLRCHLDQAASHATRQQFLLKFMFTPGRRPHLPHRVDRSFQRKNTNADTLNTRKITIKAIISTVKSASTMSSSSRVVIGDLK
jgi:hypothetical protein